ncbi:MAG: SpoIIE family protein phosphatase [bacterium]
MGEGTPENVKPIVSLARIILALALGILIPALVTSLAALIRLSYDYPYTFLYMVALLFVAYLGGLLAGLTGAVVSTFFVDYFLVGPPGLTLQELQVDAIPSALFLIGGIVVAGAGDQYRRYQARLRRDLIATQREARSEALIVAVADLLATGQERGWVLQVICQRVEEFLGDPCALVVNESDGERLRLIRSAAGTNRAVHDELGGPLALLEDPLVGEVAAASRPLVLTPRNPGLLIPESRAATEWFDRHGLAAVLAAPLRFGAEYLGCLAAFTKRPRGWNNEDIRTIEAVADRVAAAIHRDRLEVQRRRRERSARLVDGLMVQFARELDLTAMFDAITRRATDSLGDWAAIALIEPPRPELRLAAAYHPDPEKVRRLKAASDKSPLRRDNPLVARILDAPGPIAIYADDPLVQQLLPETPLLEEIFAQLNVHGGLTVPIRVGGETLGLFAVGSDSPRTWDQEDLRLASVIADRAGVAIKNARLHEAERTARLSAEREARRVQAISRVIAIAASKPNLAEVFDEFAESLQLLLPYTWVTVSLRGRTPDILVTPYIKGPAPGVAAPLERPATGTAPGWVLETQRPLVRHDASTIDEFEEDRRAGASGIRSYLIVPLSVGGRTIGTLNLGHHAPGFYTGEHARTVQSIADQLAVTISRFQLFDEIQRRAGELSETLQRALLPTELPKAPLMSVAALYRPADPEANIGGDWYDAALLPDDRVLLSVGDVAGHGVPAAAITGQVRNVIRAFALEEQRPHEILMATNRFLAMLPDSLQLSVWIGLFDPFTGDLAYAGAGHPPPYIVARGRAQALQSTGPLLGISTATVYEQTHIALEPGTRLIAYTDGLIEASRDVLEGERRLQEAAVATATEPPGHATEMLLARVLDGGSPQDDIALLVVDSLPVDAPLFFSLRAAPANLRRIRRVVRAYAERMGISAERVEDVVMAVGEAALNVVEHAYQGRQGALTIQGERQGDRLMISVRDAGRWRPPVDRGRGRGTRIMKGFTESTNTHTGPQGTVVEMTWVLDQRVSAAP